MSFFDLYIYYIIVLITIQKFGRYCYLNIVLCVFLKLGDCFVNEKELIGLAFEARQMAYSPYSHFKVGAALLSANGIVYKGCNIENASYTPTNCAERTAFFKAVSEGVSDFKAIAVVGGFDNSKEFDFCAPCGVCRQVMLEFCDYDKFKVILAKSTDDYKVFTLKEIMPLAFKKDNLI